MSDGQPPGSNHLRALAETTSDALIAIDADSVVRYVNPAVEDVLGYEPAELEGSSLTTIIPDRLTDRHLDAVDEYLATHTRHVDWDYVEFMGEHRAGHEVPLGVAISEFTVDGETYFAGVIRDITERRRRERQLVRLNEVSQAVTRAETREAVCERTVAAAESVLDMPLTAISLYDDDAGRLRRVAETDAVSDLDPETPLFAPDQDLVWEVFLDREPRVVDDLGTATGSASSPLSSVVVLPVGDHGVLVSGEAATGAFTESKRTLAEILAAVAESALDRVAREETLRDRNAELERRNAELERVNRINRVIRDITKALTQADSCEDVHQAVCDQLATAEPYQLAWFGTRDPGTDAVVPRAVAGDDDGYLESVEATAGDADQGPAARAFETGEPQVRNSLASDPPFEPWREQALRRDYQAAMSIPVVYRDAVYGVVNLYADEAGVFSESEAAVLRELGETIGYALSALERKEALVAGRSVELEFEIRDESEPLFQFLDATGAAFVLENVVANTLDALRVFCTFEGVSLDEVSAFVGGESAESFTPVRDDGDECIVEFAVPEDSVIAALIERGAMPKTARADGDAARLAVQVPPTGTVRDYVDLLNQRYADVELTARRERDEPVRTPEEFRAAYTSHLTEREHEVIQTAYYAGFFEWPRENSTQDVADTLDVSQPTVSRYLRAGERKLFSMLFEGEISES